MEKNSGKVLIVDDLSTNRQLLQRYLCEKYITLTAKNGKEALRMIDEESPDIILLDVIMPVMDGYETCRYIKNKESIQNIPVVMITSLSEKKNRIEGLESGADDFLIKPIDSYELLTRVKSLIRIKRYNDQILNQNRLYEKELEIARQVQKSILSMGSDMELSGLDFHVEYIPWLKVGGDYFNISRIEKDLVGIFLSDVMGHGVSASLITMVLKTLFEMYMQEKNPDYFLSIINKELCKMFGSTLIYATGVYLLIDLAHKKLLYTNAGHPEIILFHEEEEELEHLNSEGKPLGIYEDSEYKRLEKDLKSGDKILLYTDGLTDVENEKRESFGLERVNEFIQGNKWKSSKELINDLLKEVYDFSSGKEGFKDDINVICLTV